MLLKRLILISIFVCNSLAVCFGQLPRITSFSPASGPIGTTVTITGTNFNTTLANNRVFFGAVRGNVTAATATNLTVTVPAGATYQPISVLNTASSLYGFSAKPFGVTFTGGLIAQGSMEQRVDLNTTAGIQPFNLAIGDLDGDGKADLAVVNRASNTVSVFRNNSNPGSITIGSFDTKVDFTTGTIPVSVAIGDLDGDGKADMAVVNSGSSSVSVFRNISSSGSITVGSFSTKVDFATGQYPNSVAIGDLDGDGKAELVVAQPESNTVSVLRNTSSSGSLTIGSFSSKVDITGGLYPYSVAIGDLNGDGKADLAVANSNSNSISVFRNISSSGSITVNSFSQKVDFTTGTNPKSVAIGDLDGDGKDDLAVANETSSFVSVFRNTYSSGSISFSPKVDFTTSVNSRSPIIGDLDGDGKADLAVLSGGSISVFRNMSSSGTITVGSFSQKVDFTAGNQPSSFAIGDLDGDGKADLAVPNLNDGSVSVLRNNPTPSITSFSPGGGSSGINVTITGKNFTGATAVKFNNINATNFSVISNTSVSAVAPAGVSTGVITITTPTGTATSTGLFYAPPTITSFTPLTGSVGTLITITGTNLFGATQVRFSNGVNATPVTATATTLTFNIPSGAAPGTLQVFTPGGSITSILSIVLAPSITSFSPASGAAGQSVTISGLNFTGTTAVKFNNVNATSFSVVSNSSITAIAPAGVSTGVISITNPAGTANSTGLFYAPPTITSFTPLTGSVGTLVTITGANFVGATQVRFSNGVNVTPVTATTTTLTFNVPSGVAPGPIQVFTPGGSITSTQSFVFAPSISSFSPASGAAGQSVSISGLNFTGTTAVKFNNVNATSFSVLTNSSITAVAPAGVSSGAISISNPAGIATSTGLFYAPPTITNFTPLTGSVGTLVTITGTNLLGTTQVRFSNNVNATPVSATSTTLTFNVPGNALSGTLQVFTPGGSIISTQSIALTPQISSFTPTFGAGGQGVTITGLNFTGSTLVRFNNANATSFNVVSNTSITAVAPTGVSTGAISITNPAGIGTSSGLFYGPPTITSFTPFTGGVGTLVTITGTNLLGASQVRFSNGINATPVTATVTTLTFNVPSGAASGTLQVFTPGGSITSTTQSITLAPEISSFTPTFGGGGQSVTITGLNFTGATLVRFNNVNASSFTVNSNTSITAFAPTGVTSGAISVTGPAGTATSTGTFSGSPSISNFSPASGLIGALVTINGTNLAGVTQVRFNGSTASFTQVSGTQITAFVPSGATFGPIQVTTPAGSANSPTDFVVLIPPTISSFSPSTGPSGTVVTVNGTNIVGTTSARIGGVNCPTFSVINNNQLSITAPANAATGTISLTTGGGSATSVGIFTFIPPPTISSLSVTSGPVGTMVTVTGTGFTATAPNTTVRFANKTCSFSILSATQINVIIPSGGFTSPISVTTPAGTANSGQSFTPTGLVTILVDSVSAVAGQQVVVPVRVRGFASMIGLQFGVQFSGLTFVGIEQYNSTMAVAAANFNTAFSGSGQINFAWNQANNTATTVSDNSVLFALRFTVPACTSPGAALAINIPTSALPSFSVPLEAIKSDFTIMPSTSITGGQVKILLASLSGKVRTGNGNLVSGASVYWKTAVCSISAFTTSTGGAFSFPSLVGNANYVLAADKRNDVYPMNGVTVADIALIQRHILNVSLLGNAYKTLAADVDYSSSVTVSDVALIRDLILQTRTRFPAGRMWTMVRSNQTFVNQNSPWPFDSLRSYPTMPLTNIDQDFIGCKLGDVNDTWNPAIARVNTNLDTVFAKLGNGLAEQIGDEVQIPVHVSGSSVSGIQFTVSWPKNKLELVSQLGVFSGCVMGSPTDSTLTLLAMDPMGGLIGNGTLLANLRFKVLGPLNQMSEVKITSQVTPALAYNASFDNMTLLGLGGQISVGTVTSASVSEPVARFELWPNPAHKEFSIKGSTGTKIQLLDAVGRVVLETNISEGESKISLIGIPAGIYGVKSTLGLKRLVIE